MSIFTGITCIGGRIDYPFKNRGDTTTRIYVLRCMCVVGQYAPAENDDTMTDASAAGVDQLPTGFADADAYWVGDTDLTDLDGPVSQFERRFANIPQDRIEPLGYYAATRPGIDHSAGTTLTAVWYATSTSKSYTNSPSPRITTVVPAERVGNYSVGDTVQVFNANSWSLNGGSSSTTLRGVILSISTNTIVVDTLFFGAGASTSVTSIGGDGGATAYDLGLNLRDVPVESANVPAFVAISYVKTSTPETLPLVSRQRWINSTGDNVDLLNNTTTPSISNFLDACQDLETFQLEDESPEVWKGNIYALKRILGRYPLINV